MEWDYTFCSADHQLSTTHYQLTMTATETNLSEVAQKALDLMAANEMHAAYLHLRAEGEACGNAELLRIANMILPCQMHTQAMIALTRLPAGN